MNKKLQQQIMEMREIEQDLRTRLAKPGKELPNYVIYAIDICHNYRLKQIINKFGFPMRKLIGKKGMKAFWLLIQHQDYDIDLQEGCLNYCDFDLQEKAFLTDRISINKGKKQIYGTQFNFPIEDIKNVDKKRKQMNLEPLKEYLRKCKK